MKLFFFIILESETETANKPDCEYSYFPSSSEKLCGHETIQRGKTSIYIFESLHETCADNVRNEITKRKDEESGSSFETPEEEPQAGKKLSKTVKRSTNDEEETIVVVKKRGNKVFIEI